MQASCLKIESASHRYTTERRTKRGQRWRRERARQGMATAYIYDTVWVIAPNANFEGTEQTEESDRILYDLEAAIVLLLAAAVVVGIKIWMRR